MKPKRRIARKKRKSSKFLKIITNTFINNKTINFFCLHPFPGFLKELGRLLVGISFLVSLPESRCSQRSEGSCRLGSLPKRFHDISDSRSLITLCAENEMGKEEKNGDFFTNTKKVILGPRGGIMFSKWKQMAKYLPTTSWLMSINGQ